MSILEAEKITKFYGEHLILRGLSLKLDSAQKLGLMAESGRGKTTLLHILAGLDDDFSGRLHCDAQTKGMVFQDCALFKHKTVAENIEYPTQEKKLCTQPLYHDWLEVTGLTEYQDYYPHQLSRGMCQKVALIRAFLPNPELIFLDEPVSALDQESKEKIFTFIISQYKKTSLIMASHSRWEIEQICPSVVELETGKMTTSML